MPKHVSLSGPGDPRVVPVTATPVTTYASPIRELGLLAGQLLAARMEQRQRDPFEKPTQVVVSGSLIGRESTHPYVPERGGLQEDTSRPAPDRSWGVAPRTTNRSVGL